MIFIQKISIIAQYFQNSKQAVPFDCYQTYPESQIAQENVEEIKCVGHGQHTESCRVVVFTNFFICDLI